jgi:hypothetical protein
VDERATFHDATPQGLVGRADGRLFVLDRQGTRVIEFDQDGQPVRTWGRTGEGPGEFQYPVSLALGPGDSLWVHDSRLARLTVFPPRDGQPRVSSIRAGSGQMRVSVHGVLLPMPARPSGAGGASTIASSDYELAEWPSDGTGSVVIWRGPSARRVPVSLQEGNVVASMMASEQYAVTTRWDVLRDGTLVVADQAEYLIRIIDRDGTQRAFRSGPPPRRVTEADRQYARDQLEQGQRLPANSLLAAARSPALLRRWIEATPFADVVPRITGLIADSDDRIWIAVAGSEPGAIERIDVLNRDGERVAVVRDVALPHAFIGSSIAVRLELDEFDAQKVVLYRISR